MPMIARIEQLGRIHRRGNWLMGCGIALAVVLLLVIGGVVYVSMNIRGWTASGMDKAFTAMVDQLPLEDAEKARTQIVVDDFIARFRDGSVSMQQLAMVFKEVTESPVLPAGVAMAVGQAYFGPSGLDQAEKMEGRTQMLRIAHGLKNQSIKPEDLPSLFGPLEATTGGPDVIQFDLNGTQVRLKSPKITTDEELRAFIEHARASADAAGLSPTPPAFDLAVELDRAIRRAMGEPVDEPIEPGVIPAPAETPDTPEP